MNDGFSPPNQPIADAIVHVQCAHTSMARWAETGMLGRERALLDRLPALFGHVVLVTYGGAEERRRARELIPSARDGQITVIGNEDDLEPGLFQGDAPERVGRALRELQVSSAVVHTDQHFGGLVGVGIARVLRASGVRVGLVARGGYPLARSTAYEQGPSAVQTLRAAIQERELCHAADVVVGTTEGMTRELAIRHGLEWDRFRVIPNYVVPTGEAGPLADRAPGSVLYAGRLDPEKRIDLLIRGVALARRRVPSIRLTIIGQGRLEPELRRLASELGVAAEFRARVPHDELMRAMLRTRVYAQCSRYEGHPKTIIESLAHGTPTLVTRAPGVDDEIVPEVTGLVAMAKPQSVGDGLVRLLTDDTLASRLGAAAAKDVRPRLCIDAVAPMHIQAWRDALNIGGAHASVPAVGVRWDAELLQADPERSAEEFGAALNAFVRRLDPDARSRFVATLARHAPIAPVEAING